MGPHGMLPQSLPPMHAPPMPPMSRDGGMAGMFFGSAAGQSIPLSHSSMLGSGSGLHGIQPGGPSYHPSLPSLPPTVSDLTGVLSSNCWLPNPHDDVNFWLLSWSTNQNAVFAPPRSRLSDWMTRPLPFKAHIVSYHYVDDLFYVDDFLCCTNSCKLPGSTIVTGFSITLRLDFSLCCNILTYIMNMCIVTCITIYIYLYILIYIYITSILLVIYF